MHASNTPEHVGRGRFATTHWSMVLAAGEPNDEGAARALAQLCEAYWYPVYAYVRRRVQQPDEARDLTQAFFERLLANRVVANADPTRGRFRAFLLTACKRFLIREWRKSRAEKRGGGQPLLSLDLAAGESRYAFAVADEQTPENLFEQQWALTLLARVLERLRQDYGERGREDEFEALKPFLTTGHDAARSAPAAETLGISEGAVKVAVHRARRRYREILRAEISETVGHPDDVDDEIQKLFLVLGSKTRKNL